MSDLASFIGWCVIIFGGMYALTKVLEAINRPKELEKERKISIGDHANKIALREIYFSSDDEKIKQLAKNRYGPWALLDLELDDYAYHLKMQSERSSDTYELALAKIKKDGMPFYLEDGKIKTRWGIIDLINER